jgi:Skp family chaperone for outer membrane proteins
VSAAPDEITDRGPGRPARHCYPAVIGGCSHRAVMPLSRRLLTICATLALLLGLAGTVSAEATAGVGAARADCSAQQAAAQQTAADAEKKFDKFSKAKHKLEAAQKILAAARTPDQKQKAQRAVNKAEKKLKKATAKFQAAQAANAAAQQAYESCLAQP